MTCLRNPPALGRSALVFYLPPVGQRADMVNTSPVRGRSEATIGCIGCWQRGAFEDSGAERPTSGRNSGPSRRLSCLQARDEAPSESSRSSCRN
jgi:hypothetical protein